jgi:hypothetical protein
MAFDMSGEEPAQNRAAIFFVFRSNLPPPPTPATFTGREPCEIRACGDFGRDNPGGGERGAQGGGIRRAPPRRSRVKRLYNQ